MAGPANTAARSGRGRKPDGRSSGALRFKAIVAAFTAEIGGGAAQLSESESGLVKQAAALTLRCEQLQASIIRGEEIDDDLLVRISGTAKRLLAAIAVRASGKKPATVTLADHLARRAAEAAALQSDDDADGDDDAGS
jgi:hypothetical protein